MVRFTNSFGYLLASNTFDECCSSPFLVELEQMCLRECSVLNGVVVRIEHVWCE